MTALLQQLSIPAQTRRPALGNGIQPIGVLPIVQWLTRKGDIA